jgi:hypothetical protein
MSAMQAYQNGELTKHGIPPEFGAANKHENRRLLRDKNSPVCPPSAAALLTQLFRFNGFRKWRTTVLYERAHFCCPHL